MFFQTTRSQSLACKPALGIQLEPWGGAILKWTDDKSEDHGLTVWHVAEKNTEWFSPSPSSFMINYRIDNMSEMLADLKRNGVEIWKGPESHENGKFAWILDPDGNKVELWAHAWAKRTKRSDSRGRVNRNVPHRGNVFRPSPSPRSRGSPPHDPWLFEGTKWQIGAATIDSHVAQSTWSRCRCESSSELGTARPSAALQLREAPELRGTLRIW